MSISMIIGLVVAGLLLIGCEIFVPGGIVGTLGAILVAVGIAAGFSHSANLGFAMLVGSMAAGAFGFWLWVKLFPGSRFGKKVILAENAGDWHGFDPAKQTLLGRRGVAHTLLRPGGTAMIDGKRVDVVSRGEIIEAGRRIEVIQVEGNRIVVTEAVEQAVDLPASTAREAD